MPTQTPARAVFDDRAGRCCREARGPSRTSQPCRRGRCGTTPPFRLAHSVAVARRDDRPYEPFDRLAVGLHAGELALFVMQQAMRRPDPRDVHPALPAAPSPSRRRRPAPTVWSKTVVATPSRRPRPSSVADPEISVVGLRESLDVIIRQTAPLGPDVERVLGEVFAWIEPPRDRRARWSRGDRPTSAVCDSTRDGHRCEEHTDSDSREATGYGGQRQ